MAVADAPEESIDEAAEEDSGDPAAKLLALELKSMEGKQITLGSAITKQLALVALMRHFGWYTYFLFSLSLSLSFFPKLFIIEYCVGRQLQSCLP